MAKKLLVVVDMQTDFMDKEGSALPVPGSSKIIEPMQKFLDSLNPKEYAAVLFTQDWHKPGHIELAADGTPFPPHCIEGTPGSDLVVTIDNISEDIGAFYLLKNEFDMWLEKDISVTNYDDSSEVSREEFFDKMKKDGVDTIEVCGVCSDVCVMFAIKGVLEHGFKVVCQRQFVKGLFAEIDEVNDKTFGGKVELS